MTTLEYRSAPPVPSKMWILAILGAWILGAQLWLLTDRSLVRTSTALTVYAASVAICFVPQVRRMLFWLATLLDRRGRGWTPMLFAIVAIGSVVFLYWTAAWAKRQFEPVIHDEFSYLLQATMLAHGHLAMPAHPLSAFFDTFYVITDRAYASQYFPGAALMFVPGVWLGLPGWVMPLIVTGAVAGMLFLVFRELFDGLCALSAVGVLCGVQWFRFLSITPMAQHPALLLGLIAIYATLRFIDTRQLRWLVTCSAALGWMAITRPVDAIVYAIPLGILTLLELRKLPPADWRKLALAVVAPALPFLLLQLVTNYQVTGNVLQTPFAYYAQRDLPGTGFGFHSDEPAARPTSPLPQKQMFYADNVRPLIAAHTPGQVLNNWYAKRARTMSKELFGDMLLLAAVPAALLVLRDRRRWMVVSILPLWCLAFSFYVFDYAHYYVLLLPSVIVLIYSGFESFERIFPRGIEIIRCVRATLPVAISVMALPQLKLDIEDQFLKLPMEASLRQIESKLAEPSIVLVRWGPLNMPHAEVVYNVHTTWPDDAKIIRAHDLGDDRNQDLYRYYTRREPDRMVYLFDRDAGTFARLGFVSELLKTSEVGRDSISAAGKDRPSESRVSQKQETVVHE